MLWRCFINTLLNIEFPFNAQVECIDGVCGHSVYVLINPVIDQVTHLVVKENDPPNTEYIIPIDFVTETTSGRIRLHCSKAEMEMGESFIKTKFIKEMGSIIHHRLDIKTLLQSFFYLTIINPPVPVYDPVREFAIHQGTPVEATDGYIGKVDELVVNRENGHITHLVMREDHLWGKKDIIIPVSAMDNTYRDTSNDCLFLTLNRQQVHALSPFTLHWLWD